MPGKRNILASRDTILDNVSDVMVVQIWDILLYCSNLDKIGAEVDPFICGGFFIISHTTTSIPPSYVHTHIHTHTATPTQTLPFLLA